jgi:hypothetical protein
MIEDRTWFKFKIAVEPLVFYSGNALGPDAMSKK